MDKGGANAERGYPGPTWGGWQVEHATHIKDANPAVYVLESLLTPASPHTQASYQKAAVMMKYGHPPHLPSILA